MSKYYVSPLGGLDLGASIMNAAGTYNNIKNSRAAREEQQQRAAERAEDRALRGIAHAEDREYLAWERGQKQEQVEAQKLAQAQQQEQRMRAQEEFNQAWGSGDIKELHRLGADNPDILKAFESEQQYMSDETKAVRRRALQKITMGGDIQKIASEAADQIDALGGNSEHTRKIADLAKLNPEEARLQAEKFQAILFGDDYKALQEFGRGSGLPDVLKDGFNDEQKAQADATYKAAGGGEAGLKALEKLRENINQENFQKNTPNLAKNLYPDATPQQLSQLSEVAKNSKDRGAAIKSMDAFREKQKRDEKGLAFKDKAISLLKKIKDNPQLGDVLGSIEGAYDMRLFSDDESELIADIQEASDILTSGNLGLMVGVLSETDLQLIKNMSSGALNRRRSEDTFVGNVETLINTMSKAKPREPASDSLSNKNLSDDQLIEHYRMQARGSN